MLTRKQLVAIVLLRRRRQLRFKVSNRRQFGIRPLLRERRQIGEYYRLILRMREVDPTRFFDYFRMSPAVFDDLLGKISPFLHASANLSDSKRGRKPVPAAEQLAVCLKYAKCFALKIPVKPSL